MTNLINSKLKLEIGPLNLFDCNQTPKEKTEIESLYGITDDLEYFLYSQGNDLVVNMMDHKFARIVFYLQLTGHKQKVESFDIVGKMVVTCSSDTKVLLFDLTNFKNTSQLNIKGHAAKVTSCKISPDRKRVVSVDLEGNIVITLIADES